MTSIRRAITLAIILLAVGCGGGRSGRDTGPRQGPRPPRATTEISLHVGITADGRPDTRWIEAITPRHDAAALPEVLAGARRLDDRERAWLERMEALAPAWVATTPRLAVPFVGITPPRRVVLLAGNVGGDDGFTAGTDTLAVDLSSWVKAYGEAGTAENDDRILRILSHEYTHLLVAAWAERHPVSRATPLERALWTCFNEGLGNHRSLSTRWVTPDGELTELAEATLDRLGPIFVAQLVALAASPDPETEARLVARLSRGPFEQKWGALTVALWLAREARGDDRALRPFVDAGPAGVLALARRNLPPELAARLPVSAAAPRP
jgi:hypothetical protein